MKGLIFTEFLEMVEEKFGWEIADAIIVENDLESEGAYTSVGTYDYNELIKMVNTLSLKTSISVAELLKTAGMHLFVQLHKQHPAFFKVDNGTFEFLERVDQHIHVEVNKLYSGAELPRFFYERPSPNQLVMIYESERPLADIAAGMLSGAVNFFGEPISIEREDLGSKDGRSARFTLTK